MKFKPPTVIGVLAIALFCAHAPSARAEIGHPVWAPATQASIHPGISVYTNESGCTANFVFFDGSDIYLGQAAHCSSDGGPSDAYGCDTDVLPVGTPVEIRGAQPGTIVYNSWVTMQEIGERDEGACWSNDFALIRLNPADHRKVNPSVPFWGGPKGIDGSAPPGERVYGFGNSSVRLDTGVGHMTGFAVGSADGGWAHLVYTVTPAIPGDSGSAMLGSSGGALGIQQATSLAGSLFPASSFVVDLKKALDYMKAHTDFDAVQLANGTESFSALG